MNSSQVIDAEQTANIETVGLVLRRAREEQAKSRDDAAQEINLRLDQLDALEHDQFDRLPGDAFVRGYLRTYARWLKLDVDQVLADYIKQTGAGESVSLSRDLNNRGPIHSGSDNTKFVSAGIVVALFILGFWLYNANRESIAEPAIAGNETTVDTFSGQPLEETEPDLSGLDAVSSELSIEVDAAATEPSRSMAGGGEEQSPWQNPFTSAANERSQQADVNTTSDPSIAASGQAAGVGEPVPVTTQTQVPTPRPSPAASAVSSSTAPERAVFSSGITTRGAGPDELLFHFSEDCWLEVKNDDGRTLYSAARKAGQSLLVKGTAPFYVLVGNAPGVQLSFNGKDVEVRSRNRRNSARLTLRN